MDDPRHGGHEYKKQWTDNPEGAPDECYLMTNGVDVAAVRSYFLKEMRDVRGDFPEHPLGGCRRPRSGNLGALFGHRSLGPVLAAIIASHHGLRTMREEP